MCQLYIGLVGARRESRKVLRGEIEPRSNISYSASRWFKPQLGKYIILKEAFCNQPQYFPKKFLYSTLKYCLKSCVYQNLKLKCVSTHKKQSAVCRNSYEILFKSVGVLAMCAAVFLLHFSCLNIIFIHYICNSLLFFSEWQFLTL